MRRWPPLALACALVLHGPAAASPYTIDTALALEQLGPVRLAANNRWAVIQTYGPWEGAARYDLDWWATYGLGRLSRVDLRTGAVAPLLAHQAGSGYVAGPMSPSGAKIAVSRLAGHDWELGVVEIASGQTRWLGVSPELPLVGRGVAWRNDDELVVIAQPDQPVGHRLGYGWQAQAQLTKAWSEAAAGRVAVNALGSGRYRQARARGPAKQLLLVNVMAGARRLATGDFIDLEIAPGGRTVAAIANGEDLQSTDGVPTSGTPRQRRRLLLADLRTGALSDPCPRDDIMLRVLSWSASGERLLIYARTEGDWSGGKFQIADARTSTVVDAAAAGLTPSLTRSMEGAIQASGAWMGETPVVYAQPVGALPARPDWYALGPGAPRNLTFGLAAPSSRLRAAKASGLVAADGERLWRISADGRSRVLKASGSQLVRADAAADSERLALAPPASIAQLAVRTAGGLGAMAAPDRLRIALARDDTPLAISPDASQVIITRRDAHGVERIVLKSPRGSERLLLTLNAGLAAITPAKVQPIHHKGPDGQPLTSWLYLPPDLKPGQKPPLIVIPYPGDVHADAPNEHDPGTLRLYNNVQVLVGAGYAVLAPSLPYAANREPLDGLADQVLTAVDAAASQAPVDAARLAVWGHSYGGYAALALATQNERFKAVIASAAIADLTSFYARLAAYTYAVPEAGVPVMSSAGWSESGQARMNGPPLTDPDRYRRNSPISLVDHIRAPVMLITGDMDKDPTQAEQMFTSLYRRNKDAVLLIYRGESHVILGPGNVRDEYARVFAFLADQIGPGVAPVG
jgi:dipeptidyl aminopeptidase/acylaminoacyl peptidase